MVCIDKDHYCSTCQPDKLRVPGFTDAGVPVSEHHKAIRFGPGHRNWKIFLNGLAVEGAYEALAGSQGFVAMFRSDHVRGNEAVFRSIHGVVADEDRPKLGLTADSQWYDGEEIWEKDFETEQLRRIFRSCHDACAMILWGNVTIEPRHAKLSDR